MTATSNIIKEINSSVFVKEDLAPRAVVGATCILSMIGSVTIILSYIAFKQLRNPTRHILLHLSLMDLGVALGNFIGATVYFDKYYFGDYHKPNGHGSFHATTPLVDYSCTVQAAVSVTCNNSSVLWTIAVAVYLHFRIVSHPNRPMDKRFFGSLIFTLAVICYGIPILLTMWLLWTQRLGFAPYDSSGWCTIIVLSPDRSRDDILAGVLGNDLWIYLAFFLIPALYFSIKAHAKRQYAAIDHDLDLASKSRLQAIDLKFTAIPLIFMVLRLGSVVVSILYEYLKVQETMVPKWLNYIILYYSGFGDSAQGAANGFLFIVLTKTARDLIFQKLICCRKSVKQADKENLIEDENTPLNSTSKEGSEQQGGGRTLMIIQDT